LRKRWFSKSETAKVIEIVLQEEGRSPGSLFDLVQGIAALARGRAHQDARLEIADRRNGCWSAPPGWQAVQLAIRLRCLSGLSGFRISGGRALTPVARRAFGPARENHATHGSQCCGMRLTSPNFGIMYLGL
jgi:hypothetical protein